MRSKMFLLRRNTVLIVPALMGQALAAPIWGSVAIPAPGFGSLPPRTCGRGGFRESPAKLRISESTTSIYFSGTIAIGSNCGFFKMDLSEAGSWELLWKSPRSYSVNSEGDSLF